MLIITACCMVHQKQEQDSKKTATSCIPAKSYTKQGCEIYDTELRKCFAELCPTQLVISRCCSASFSILHRIHKVGARHFPKDGFPAEIQTRNSEATSLALDPLGHRSCSPFPPLCSSFRPVSQKNEAAVTVTGNGEQQSCGRRRISTYGIWAHWAWDMSHCLQLLFDPNLLLCVLGCWFNPDPTRPPIGRLCLNL